MMEELKYETIKHLADHPDSSKERAALKLGCTVRHINRMLCGYRNQGKEYFVHGNRGRKPANTIPDSVKTSVVTLYTNKYYDANFTHFTELLAKHEDIFLSTSSVTSILEDACIYSPRLTKTKKKRIKKELNEKRKAAKTNKELTAIQTNLVALEDAHSRRPRCAYFGELLQMDASPFEWIPGQIWHLHLSIDDASGIITGAYFDTQETLNAYYHLLHQILTNYGIPYKLLTDRRTVFTYKKKKNPSVDEDTYTQFAYACNQLGIELESTSIPQAKGRIERLNQTLQSRLPIELRLAGVTTLDAANEFLNSYIKEFNAKFALPLNGIKSVFEEQPTDEKINLILAVLSERVVDCGHSIKYKNNYYRMVNSHGIQVNYLGGTKVMVIESYDGNMYCCVNDKDIYALEVIPEHQAVSPRIDLDQPVPKPKKKTIPSMNHPWRKNDFKKFVQKQHILWTEKSFYECMYTSEDVYLSQIRA